MFNGFTDETVDFMWGIRFNNEKQWFQAHKDIYLTQFYQPLRALGEETDAPGTVLLEQLTAKTGVPAPAPLAALKNKAVRFTECVEKTEMLPAVDAFVR